MKRHAETCEWVDAVDVGVCNLVRIWIRVNYRMKYFYQPGITRFRFRLLDVSQRKGEW